MDVMDYVEERKKTHRENVGKSRKNRKKLGTFSFEQREFLITKFVTMYMVPLNRPSLAKCAKELGVTVLTLVHWKKSALFQKVCSELRKELRARWGAEVDRVVVRKALRGNGYFATLYYKLQDELIDRSKVEHSTPQDIPNDPDELKKEIDQLALEVGAMKDREHGKSNGAVKRKESR